MRLALGMGLTGWLLVATAAGVRAAEIALLPVGADGAHAIVGNEILLSSPGQRVFLEVRISGWDPTGVRRLRSWQASIDSSGYSNGTLGVLTVASVACAASSDCAAAFGGACSLSGMVCNQDADCPFPQPGTRCRGPQCDFPLQVGGFCSPGFILSAREDYVFAGLPGGEFPAVDESTPDFRFASAAVSDSVVDPGTSRYAGTLVLDVPVSASGVYEIGFLTTLQSNSQLVADDFSFFEPLTLTPARIVVAECALDTDCDDGNACTADVCRADSTCGHAPNFDDTRFCCDPGFGDLCARASGVIGDGNFDGLVDLRDFAALQSRCFGPALIPFRCEPFDADCNCRVNLDDLPGYVSGMTGPGAP